MKFVMLSVVKMNSNHKKKKSFDLFDFLDKLIKSFLAAFHHNKIRSRTFQWLSKIVCRRPT